MLRELSKARGVPPLAPRAESLAFFREHVYGTPPPPLRTGLAKGKAQIVLSGAATLEPHTLLAEAPGGASHAVDFELLTPRGASGRSPLFLFISFRRFGEDSREEPEKSTPYGRILARGYAVARFCYHGASTDERGTRDGLLRAFEGDSSVTWGKIGAWAWAASRILDHLSERGDLDLVRAAVVGHSRLGKTALWCAAQDERFSLAVAVQSGCGGAAISRGKVGEQLSGMTKTFPDWFCEGFQAYAPRLADYPFDQHDLIAAIAPRRVYVCSASEDEWADPNSEFLACAAASPAFGPDGEGLVSEDRLPRIGDVFHSGRIGFHLRAGSHAFVAEDWDRIMDYRDRHEG